MSASKRTKASPRVSVIIPAVNEEAYIGRAADSVRAQGYSDLQLVVVVNGATDGTERIARENGRADTVLVYPNKLGFSGARNTGANQADGDILVFLDADSYFEAGTLPLIVRAWQDGYDVGTVRGQPDKPAFIHRFLFFFRNFAHRFNIYKGIMGGCLFCDADMFRKVGGYADMAEVDEHYDIIRRMREKGGRYVFVHKATSYTSMRRHDKHGIWKVFAFWLIVLGKRINGAHSRGLKKWKGRASIYEDR